MTTKDKPASLLHNEKRLKVRQRNKAEIRRKMAADKKQYVTGTLTPKEA